MPTYRSASGSSAEDLFIELFSDTFGAEKAGYLYSQYPFSDIYQNSRFADFLIENSGRKVAIEIDDEASHNPKLISQNKFYDDLLKQNSMIYLGWDVYRWAVRQMQQQPETVKDELRVFLGQHPSFREIEDYLPTQRGKSLDGSQLELKEHQKQALAALEEMRCSFETIALLYHATGTGKTVTAVMDAKRFGKRTAVPGPHGGAGGSGYQDLPGAVAQGHGGSLCGEHETGQRLRGLGGSIQSVALNLERFKPDDFGYIIVDEAHHASADTYQKVLSYFTPEFTLGLTATPERADDKNILDIFKNTAHKLDIQTAVEIGELVAGALHPHPHQHRPDQSAVQQRSVQHPGSGEQDLCAGAQSAYCRYLAPVCKGQADRHSAPLSSTPRRLPGGSMTPAWPLRPCPA